MHCRASGLHLCLGFLVAERDHGAGLGKDKHGVAHGPQPALSKKARSRDMHPHFPAELDGVWVPPCLPLGTD